MAKKSTKVAVVSPAKVVKKGKRDAEVALEKNFGAKKQKRDHLEAEQAALKKKVEAKTQKEEYSSSSEEESSESDEEPKEKKPVPVKTEASSSDSSSDDSDEEESDDGSDDEPPKTKKVATEDSESEDSSDEDSSEEEEDSSEDDSSSEEESDESDDEPPKTKKVATEDSESEDSSDEDSSEEEEEKPAKTPKKPPQTPAIPEGTSKTLFVGNLSFNVERADVEEFFREAGEVVDVRFATDWEGVFRGYGHVEFATAQAAQEALKLHCHELLNRPVRLDLAKERGAYTVDEAKPRDNAGGGFGGRGGRGGGGRFGSGGRDGGGRFGNGFTRKRDAEVALEKNVGEKKQKRDLEAEQAALKEKVEAETQKEKYSSSEEESSESDEEPEVKVAPKKVGIVAKPPVESSSDEDSSSEEDVPPKKQPVIAAKNAIEAVLLRKAEPVTSKTLFVGNLSYNVERADVEEFFKDAAEVVDVRFATDREGTFRGYGHVEFATAEAAQEALKLHDHELLNRPVRLDLAKYRGACNPSQGTTISVRGFDKSGGEDQIRSALLEHFGSCGEIKRCSIYKYYDSGKLKGYVDIEFSDSGAFNKALELDGSDLQGSYLTVDEAKPRDNAGGGGGAFGGRGGRGGGGRFGSGGRDGGGRFGNGDRSGGRSGGRDEFSSDEDSSSEEDVPPKKQPVIAAKNAIEAVPLRKAEPVTSKTLFVGNLSYNVERADVEEFFKDAAEVVDVRFATDREGVFRGYGHVEFATAEAAQEALKLHDHELLNRPVRLDLAKERGTYTPGTDKGNSFQKGGQSQGQSIFVRGFDKSGGEDEIRSALQEHFGSCGEITRCSIYKDYDSGKLKGYAYIEFSDSGAFNKALELNGSDLKGSYLKVDEAKPRDNAGGGGFGGSGGRGGGGRFGSGGRDGGGRFGNGGRSGGRSGGRDEFSSDEDSSSEEDVPPKKQPVIAAKNAIEAVPLRKAEPVSSSSELESEDSDSEEEEKRAGTIKKVESSDDTESEDSSSSDDDEDKFVDSSDSSSEDNSDKEKVDDSSDPSSDDDSDE